MGYTYIFATLAFETPRAALDLWSSATKNFMNIGSQKLVHVFGDLGAFA